MPQVTFTANLRRHLTVPDGRVEQAASVREALDAVFRDSPRLRGYVLDEQGRLRTHVTVFVDGEVIADRLTLADELRPDSEVFVMQALSGG